MSCHNGLYTIFNNRMVNFTIGCIPLFRTECIDSGKQMLVSAVYSISREMFCSGCHTMALACFNILHCHCFYTVLIISKGSDIGNRIFEIHINVNHRSKRPVHTNCCSFCTGYIAQIICFLHISGCCHLNLSPKKGSFISNSVSAGL